MSDFKTQEQIEFAELFAKLKQRGINGVDVAQELQTTAQTVSYYNTGQRNPRPLTMDKLRAYVKKVCGESPGENEVDHWKSRAEVAEKELAELRRQLQKLGTIPEQKVAAEPAERPTTATPRRDFKIGWEYDADATIDRQNITIDHGKTSSSRGARRQSSPQKLVGSEFFDEKDQTPKAC